MAGERRPWTRDELLVALSLYLQLPFGRLHRGTPEIKHHAQLLERTPSALAMKLTNFASIDDSIDRAGLRNVAKADRDLWAEMKHDWPAIAEAIDAAKAQFGIATTDDTETDGRCKSQRQSVRTSSPPRKSGAAKRSSARPY